MRFSNVGTHIPYFFKYGPGIVDTDKQIEIFSEKDEDQPNQILYDLDTGSMVTNEDQITNKIKRNKSNRKVFTRNVNDKRYRNPK